MLLVSTLTSTLVGALAMHGSLAYLAGWAVYVGATTLFARLLGPKNRSRAHLVPYALALSVLPSLGILVFALLWRDAFRDSASTLPRNALEHLGRTLTD